MNKSKEHNKGIGYLVKTTPELYRKRFTPQEQARKNLLWKVLCRDFFQKYVSKESAVLDIGAGYCEFINHISCKEKIAIDVNTDTTEHAGEGVRVIIGPAQDLSAIENASIDVVFASNFFEHLPNRDTLLKVLFEIRRVLKPGGRLLILQPNVRYAYKEYWHFFEHIIPLSHLGMSEALTMCRFEIEAIKKKFLPYSTKERYPKKPFLLRLYLKSPFLHPVFGRQMFISARKPGKNIDH